MVGAEGCDCPDYDTGIYHNSHNRSACSHEIPKNGGTDNHHPSWCMNNLHTTMTKAAEVETAKANISFASANIGPVTAKYHGEKVRVAEETRPKNMRAVFIMRIE